MQLIDWVLPGTSLISFLLGLCITVVLIRKTVSKNPSVELSSLVSEALHAFLKRVASNILQITVYLTVILFGLSLLAKTSFSWIQIISFGIGGMVMTVSLSIGLYAAPKLVPYIIHYSNRYFTSGLSVMYAVSGAIGFMIVGLMLFGFSVSYLFLGIKSIIGYGMGTMLVSFFFRLGGGVYKTSVNIGSNIVSDVEKKIPSFDKRNPATILDISGDFIGKIMGYASDILSSFLFSIIACCLLAYSFKERGLMSVQDSEMLMAVPLLIVAVSIWVSIIAYVFCLYQLKTRSANFLLEGIYVSVFTGAIGTYLIFQAAQVDLNMGWGQEQFRPFISYLIGLGGAIAIGFTSEYLTSYRFKPTKQIAKEGEFGTAIMFFNGLSCGLRSNGFFVLNLLLISL